MTRTDDDTWNSICQVSGVFPVFPEGSTGSGISTPPERNSGRILLETVSLPHKFGTFPENENQSTEERVS